MTAAVVLLTLVGFVAAVPLTLAARALGRRLYALDSPGVPGQVKEPPRAVPNTGGVAIFWGVAGPMLAGLVLLSSGSGLEAIATRVPELLTHLPGIRARVPDALWLLAGAGALHVLGLIDDRRALGPRLKLAVMLAVALGVVLATDTRLLTLLDTQVGGAWLSVLVTVLWIGAVTNAFNFVDNMDGLAGGIGVVAGTCFLASTLVNPEPQWFVAAVLALLVGALLGFLVFNAPRPLGGSDAGVGGARKARAAGASIFMGDSGSLVLGFLLAFLTARTTYLSPSLGGGWYAVLMPLVVLAVPLYDLLVVSVLRVRAGRSPLVGDLNHLSHRLVRRGLSRRSAVYVIWGLTGVTALGGVLLPRVEAWQAALIGVQTLLVLVVLGLIEFAGERR